MIPVHDGERFLADAIESVLAQTVPVMECLVIDDGSHDASATIAAAFGAPVRCLHQPQSGVSAARNHGLREARGGYVAFLDHDDVWCPPKLERQLDEMERTDAGMALCAVSLVGPDLEPLGSRRLSTPGDLLTGMLMFDDTEIVSCSSTGLVRRDTLLELGGFDEALSTSADWDLLARMLLGPGIAYVDEPLSLYRIHDSNMSRRIELMEQDMLRAYAKTFADPRLPPELRRRRTRAYARLYRMLAGSYRAAGRRRDAARTLARALARQPSLLLELAARPPNR